MAKKPKPNIYVPAVTNELKGVAVGFIIWGLLLLISISAYAFMLNNERNENNKFTTDTLANVTEPCTLETTVHFDNEPIDFIIKSPSGTRYAPDGCDGYVIDMERKTITMKVHTDETGSWTVDYNKKSNLTLDIGAEQNPKEELYITRVMLNTEQNLFNFMVKYDSDDFFDIPLHAIAQLTSPSLNKTITLFDNTVAINEQNRVTLTENQIPYADDWILEIKTYEDLNVDRYHPDESDEDIPSDTFTTDDEGQTLHSIDDMEPTPEPTTNPLDNHVDGLNVSTYEGSVELEFMRTHISIQPPNHDTAY